MRAAVACLAPLSLLLGQALAQFTPASKTELQAALAAWNGDTCAPDARQNTHGPLIGHSGAGASHSVSCSACVFTATRPSRW